METEPFLSDFPIVYAMQYFVLHFCSRQLSAAQFHLLNLSVCNCLPVSSRPDVYLPSLKPSFNI